MENINIAFDAIKLYQEQYAQVDKLWGYFSVITLAVVGYAIGAKEKVHSLFETTVIVIAYLTFCIGNHSALILGQEQLHQFAYYAVELSKQSGMDFSKLNPLDVIWIKTFHIMVAISVSISIFILTLIRAKGNK